MLKPSSRNGSHALLVNETAFSYKKPSLYRRVITIDKDPGYATLETRLCHTSIRLMVFNRVTCPSVGPLLQGISTLNLAALKSWRSP